MVIGGRGLFLGECSFWNESIRGMEGEVNATAS